MSTNSLQQPVKLTPSVVSTLLDSIDYILLDVDGVLWAGDTVFEGVADTVAWLEKERSIKVRYMTNNATLSREQAAAKFRSRGLKSARVENIYSSAYVGALHLGSKLANDPSTPNKFNKNVFVVGTEGLHQEVREVLAPGRMTYGLELNEVPYNGSKVASSFVKKHLPAPKGSTSGGNVSLSDLDIGAVIIGLDWGWNIHKLSVASMLLQQHKRIKGKEEVHFVSTNRDPQIPMGKEGWLLPGAGAQVESLVAVSGRQPDVVCGKPNLPMIELLFEQEKIADRSRCLMVGDRLTTDIAFGNGGGAQTLFVLSGAESLDDVAELENKPKEYAVRHMPTFVADGLVDLWRMGQQATKASKL